MAVQIPIVSLGVLWVLFFGRGAFVLGLAPLTPPADPDRDSYALDELPDDVQQFIGLLVDGLGAQHQSGRVKYEKPNYKGGPKTKMLTLTLALPNVEWEVTAEQAEKLILDATCES